MIRNDPSNNPIGALEILNKSLVNGYEANKFFAVDWFSMNDGLYVFGIEDIDSFKEFVDEIPDVVCDFEYKNIEYRDTFDEDWEAATECAEADAEGMSLAYIVRLSNIEKLEISESTEKKLSESTIHKLVEKHDLGLINEIFA